MEAGFVIFHFQNYYKAFFKHSDKSTPKSQNIHLKFYRSIASQSSIVAKPMAFPGHTFLLEPKGINLKSNPIIGMSLSFRKCFGLNCYDLNQTSWSWVIAHMLTITMVLIRIKWLSIYVLCMESLAHEKKNAWWVHPWGFLHYGTHIRNVGKVIITHTTPNANHKFYLRLSLCLDIWMQNHLS